MEIPDEHAERVEAHPEYHLLHLEVEHSQFSDECVLPVGERPVQMISNQELGGEGHVNDNGGKLEGDTTECDVRAWFGIDRTVSHRGLRSPNGLHD